MTKEEIIQKLMDQINSINATYITIISIVLVLVTIAFSALFWLQIKLSKEQYLKMKSELKDEMVKEYNLNQIATLQESVDYTVKRSSGELIFRIAQMRLEGKAIPKEDQSKIISDLNEIVFKMDNLINVNDKNGLKKIITSACNELLATDFFKLTKNSKDRINEILERI